MIVAACLAYDEISYGMITPQAKNKRSFTIRAERSESPTNGQNIQMRAVSYYHAVHYMKCRPRVKERLVHVCLNDLDVAYSGRRYVDVLPRSAAELSERSCPRQPSTVPGALTSLQACC